MHAVTIDYKAGEALMEGYLAYDNTIQERRPAILIAHAWGGRDHFVEEKARKLADQGYIGFAMDVYGKGKRGDNPESNSQLMQPLMNDRSELQRRLLTAFEVIRQLPVVSPDKIAAIGYCFGGLCALDMARSGAELKGVMSFHGLLNSPQGLPLQKVKAKILALHGHDDPMVSPEDVLKFEQEMTEARVDWQLHVFGGAKHAFTNPAANDLKLGTVFNPVAEKRSWKIMLDFFQEIFG